MNTPDKTFKNWDEISSDPNSPDVLDYRIRTLAGMRNRKLISDRTAYLCRLAEGKNVLDIGVVEHFIASSEREEWLHGRLCKHAARCLGMDVLEKDVQELRTKGYHVIAWDVTKEPLASKFELIVVGDVIEHLGNPHALFSNAGKMLAPGGRLALTTPNPWYANAVIKNVFEGNPFTDSADHVAWFDAGTLCELAARNGLHLDRYAGVLMAPKASTARAALFFRLSPFLIKLGIRPEFFAKTMIYEFVLSPSA
jgi:2-polyprenyl-3-methyl-5-hydroxy-6-metoxy-1,4-benzoquinol methylase